MWLALVFIPSVIVVGWCFILHYLLCVSASVVGGWVVGTHILFLLCESGVLRVLDLGRLWVTK